MEIVIKPVKDVYYDKDSNYGIFACEIVKETEDSKKILYNKYGNFTVKGIMPLLKEDRTYVAKVKQVNDKKYGNGYEIITIYEETPTTLEEQKAFLRLLLTENQVREIMAIYPNENIIELIEEDKFDYSLVKGIGESTFERIKKKILENKHLQRVFLLLQAEYGLTHNMIKRLIDHFQSPDLLLEKIQENPYILADEVDGIGFKKADDIAFSQGIEKDSDYRLEACMKYVLNEGADNGHVYIEETDLRLQMRDLLAIKSNQIQAFLEKIKLEEIDGLKIIDRKYSLLFHYKNEWNIATDIKRLSSHSYELQVSNLEERIIEIEHNQGFNFTGEQREAIFSAIEGNVVVVNGKAGTGKTSLIKGIVNILKSAREDYTYHTVALSGKASQRIKDSTGLKSSTIHSFLCPLPENLMKFKYNVYNPVEIDLLVIDEASMINAHLFAKLLEALPNGTKVIITGDYSQLEPIGAGNVFYDLCHSKNVTRIELTQVHRQAKKSGILSIANEVRDGYCSFEKGNYENRNLGELQDLHFYPYKNKDNILKKVLHVAQAYKNRGNDILKFQVITPMKKRGILCTFELNKQLQDIFNPLDGVIETIKKGKSEFREKDKVIHNGNNYEIGVLNGTLGIIDKINHEEEIILVNFENVGIVPINFENLKDIDLSYALTVHRTQGSQFENCVVAFDFSAYIMLSKELVYTALTRAINHCYLVCELDSLIYAIKTDKSSHRNTFLRDFLSDTL